MESREVFRGYRDARYAAAFAEWGMPWHLSGAGGWGLIRRIPNSDRQDAMHCYPLLACMNWADLADDLTRAPVDLVSFSAVIDPLAAASEAALRAAFPDVLTIFKRHFLVDLRGTTASGSAAHRRKVRQARRHVDTEILDPPESWVSTWLALYAELAHRHDITGIRAFSADSFTAQFRVPGMIAVRAVSMGATVGMTLWVQQGDDVYYHLGAQSARGYATVAGYAMFDAAIMHFRSLGCRMLSLGGGAGAHGASDGLTRFKQGWATASVPAFFGGKIVDARAYAELTLDRSDVSYFPAYRAGEFR